MNKFIIKKEQVGYAFAYGILFGGLYFVFNSINDEGIEFARKLGRYILTALIIGFSAFLGSCGFFMINNNVKKND
ncbi:hypothetical protein LCGC14_1118820 [marine sediment metagenome]|uniref:Uncharacterized protein n=1 Tax=marine sediment metagenome TaxID=412755 RepID=A0A0F9MSJ1_9ZZZZ